MYKIHFALTSFIRGACQQLLEPLSVSGKTIGGNVLRPLYTSSARFQEAEVQSQELTSSTTSPKSSREFSFYPPLPGQDSSLRWGGKTFEELPIVHIKATYNNTHIQVTDNNGQSMARTSCGTEGFRNIKKSTPIAAQTTGIAAAAKAQAKGVTFVRVLVKGLGPGRLSAIKGLTMGGLEIVSITDNTPVPHNGCRPRKARRM
ncbi:28S ribosomal protein S11, mitochondrial [Tachysurus fulvidraco]|uniref:28S ribosomal protein S11, mitochondrial n=1 Tax=Tachysurus fulvidraco TaxID=1234273 RepID=UPI000F50A24F|nr:28S ribosomal protein S11, mitochondrial [Tachysurus fulvidraco]